MVLVIQAVRGHDSTAPVARLLVTVQSQVSAEGGRCGQTKGVITETVVD